MKSSVMKNESRMRLARIAICTMTSSAPAVSTGRRRSQWTSWSSGAGETARWEAVLVDVTR